MRPRREAMVVFEYLLHYHYVIVTGPQRSGTRIGAKMIAYDTGYTYVDEAEVKADSVYQLATIEGSW